MRDGDRGWESPLRYGPGCHCPSGVVSELPQLLRGAPALDFSELLCLGGPRKPQYAGLSLGLRGSSLGVPLMNSQGGQTP